MIADISEHEGKINWDKFSQGLDFVLIRATGDLEFDIDPFFHVNAKECVSRGIPMHVFCFSRTRTPEQAEVEARTLYKTASPYRPVSYVLDLEGQALNGDRIIETANAFCATLRKLGVKKIGLYTGHSAFQDFGLGAINYDWLWIARYGKNTGKVPGPEYHPIPCDLWQYTSNAVVPGITENTVDLNLIWGDKKLSYFTGGDDMGKVLVGSARIDENGQAHGGRAGDQTGREVSTQEWYKHEKGWNVFRAKDPAARKRIADCMQAACDNPHVGYDQYQRETLYKAAEPLGFNCTAVTTDVETDCSALVRVCCAFAGIGLPNFNTETEKSTFMKSGAFDQMEGAKYTDAPDFLLRGDVLCTREKGHTVVVLNDGRSADGSLCRGDKGEDVKMLQLALLAHGISVGPDGADGDFGKNTEKGVKDFQKAVGLPETGIADVATLAALNQPEPLYTVTLRHVPRADMESLRANWPQCEVAEE